MTIPLIGMFILGGLTLLSSIIAGILSWMNYNGAHTFDASRFFFGVAAGLGGALLAGMLVLWIADICGGVLVL